MATTDYEALARQFGGRAAGPAPAPAATPLPVTPATPPAAQAALPVTPQTPQGKVVDFTALAAQFGGQAAQQSSTTLTGLAGAITRGVAPIAAGATFGAVAGAPFAGVGAAPGAIAGAGAAGLAMTVGDPIVSTINSLFGTQYTLPTDAMADLLTRVGVAQPRTEAERIVQATAAGAGGAGGIAAAGRAVQTAASAKAPVTRGVGRMLAAQPVAQIAGGAGAGAAGQAVREAGGTPGGEILASLAGGVAGGMAGARMAAPARAPVAAPKVQPVIEEAGRRGVPVMTSDVIPPKTFIGKAAQRVGERVPIAGTGPMRAAQQTARIEAVRGLLREFGADDVANLSDDVMADLAAKRSADLTKYSGSKKEVINRLADQGTVPVPRAMQAIDDQIDDLLRRRTEGAEEAVERLRQIKTDLQNRDLFQLEAYRQDELAKVFKDDPVRPMSLASREVGEKALRAIYRPVKEDMGDFIKATGERRDFNKWMVADKRLAEMAGELEMTTLKSVLKSGNATPEVVNRLLFSQKPSEVRQLYSSLTPTGRATARTSILAQAAQKAEYETGNGVRMFSPEKFNAELKRLQPQIGIFFKGDDLKQVEGLSRVLTLTRRAGEAGVATPTGQEAVPFVAGGMLQSLLGSFGGSLAAAGGVGLAARLYESAPVRNQMLKLAQTKAGSAEEAALAKRLLATIQTQAEAIQAKAQETQE